MTNFDDLETPSLLIERGKVSANLRRMRERASALGVVLRPHMKTLKVAEVLDEATTPGDRRVTVSTMREAAFYAAHGVNDILYGVGISQGKLPQVADLIRAGTDLTVILDSPEAAAFVSEFGTSAGIDIPVMIEIDTDGHRSGLLPDNPSLPTLAAFLASSTGVRLRGVMTHAGESYSCFDEASLQAIAEQERAGAVFAAMAIRSAGIECRDVSVGSTPTALSAVDLTGVTELRAGVYMSFDLVMAGIGVCTQDEIALSVLCTVIGHRPDKNWVITDAGFMALSRDRGTASQPVDQGYGLVCDNAGSIIPDLWVTRANQEHGTISTRSGKPLDMDSFPIGRRLRILPNHACATAAQYEAMNVVSGTTVDGAWHRANGW